MAPDEKLDVLAEVLDLEVAEITPTTALDDLEEWNSLAALSLIVMLDERFGKTISNTEINAFKTVEDIMNIME